MNGILDHAYAATSARFPSTSKWGVVTMNYFCQCHYLRNRITYPGREMSDLKTHTRNWRGCKIKVQRTLNEETTPNKKMRELHPGEKWGNHTQEEIRELHPSYNETTPTKMMELHPSEKIGDNTQEKGEQPTTSKQLYDISCDLLAVWMTHSGRWQGWEALEDQVSMVTHADEYPAPMHTPHTLSYALLPTPSKKKTNQGSTPSPTNVVKRNGAAAWQDVSHAKAIPMTDRPKKKKDKRSKQSCYANIHICAPMWGCHLTSLA